MVTSVVILVLIVAIVIPVAYRVDFTEFAICLAVIAACLAWLDGII